MFECRENDKYYTPKSVWEDIKDYIPKDKVIWESFYGDGKSGDYLKELGFEVIHEPIDFFTNNKGDIVVSNPPFSMCKKIINRLVNIEKPFILLLPVQKMCFQYFMAWGKNNKDFQIIIPKRRIQFDYEGKDVSKKRVSKFDCLYYCWKIGLENDINFL